MCGSAPKPKDLPPAPPPPAIPNDKANKKQMSAAASAEKQKAAAASGYQSTIVTGPLGVQEDATTKKKTLLGQGQEK